MAKYNWNPWVALHDMDEALDRVMDQSRSVRRRDRLAGRPDIWQPRADVCENTDAYVIEVELAGVRRRDIGLEVHGQELYVYGEARAEKDATGGVFHVLERQRGPFARLFTLPGDVETGGIFASFGNGLLTITVPKRGQHVRGAMRIEITKD